MDKKQMLGTKIYNLRKSLGYTQQQLAQLLGISNKAISKWETSESNPDIGIMPRLASVLGTSVESLFASTNTNTQLISMTIGQLLEDTASKYATTQAVKYVEFDYNRTYYELNRDVDRIAKGLLGIGISKGDHVAVWATNYPQWLLLFLATSKIGAILVTANTNYKSGEIEYLLKHSDSKALFVCDGIKDIDCIKIMYGICPELKTSKKGDLRSRALPRLRMVVSMDNFYQGCYHWDDIIGFGVIIAQDEYDAVRASLDPHDTINVQYTSGTTGFPKGVMLSHYNIVNNAYFVGQGMSLSNGDRMCIPVPFFHCFGLVLSILCCVAHGSTMVPLLYYAPLKVMRTIEYEKCTVLNGVPTMFINILEHRDFDNYDFSSLRTGIIAGSLCPQPLMESLINKMNMRDIVIVYGQTEASPACTITLTTDSQLLRTTTVGKDLPFVHNKIVDATTGIECEDGQAGEFLTKGYHIMKGYYKMPESTAAAIDKDGWLHTGDLVMRTSDGYYKVTGRIKDIIIRGGENIFPKEIEDLLSAHPNIKAVQIVAVPSKVYGEEVCAFCIKREGVELDEKAVKQFVAKNMARHKIPSYVHFMDSFPMTASGKVQKFKLREYAKEIFNLVQDNFVYVDKNIV